MIFGISGKKKSGKDLTGTIIQWLLFKKQLGFKTPSNVEDFEEWVEDCKLVSGGTEYMSQVPRLKFADKLKDIVCMLTGCSRKDLENEAFKNKELGGGWKTKTYRYILEFIGTNLFRNQLYEDVWVDATLNDSAISEDDYIIVTDTRFPNELDGIKKLGGLVIRINRPSVKRPEDEHECETALDNSTDFDYVITNNDVLADLIETVRQILIEKGII